MHQSVPIGIFHSALWASVGTVIAGLITVIFFPQALALTAIGTALGGLFGASVSKVVGGVGNPGRAFLTGLATTAILSAGVYAGGNALSKKLSQPFNGAQQSQQVTPVDSTQKPSALKN